MTVCYDNGIYSTFIIFYPLRNLYDINVELAIMNKLISRLHLVELPLNDILYIIQYICQMPPLKLNLNSAYSLGCSGVHLWHASTLEEEESRIQLDL